MVVDFIFVLLGLYLIFSKHFHPILRVTSYLLSIHRPYRLIDIVHMKYWTLLCHYLTSTLKCLLIKVACYLCLTYHINLLCRQYFYVFIFLFTTLIKKPLTSLHNIIMIKSVCSLTLLFGEIAAKTLENLINWILIYYFMFVLFDFSWDIKLGEDDF